VDLADAGAGVGGELLAMARAFLVASARSWGLRFLNADKRAKAENLAGSLHAICFLHIAPGNPRFLVGRQKRIPTPKLQSRRIFINIAMVKEIDQSGFIDQLYKK
jgi:hypothetical protein